MPHFSKSRKMREKEAAKSHQFMSAIHDEYFSPKWSFLNKLINSIKLSKFLFTEMIT